MKARVSVGSIEISATVDTGKSKKSKHVPPLPLERAMRTARLKAPLPPGKFGCIQPGCPQLVFFANVACPIHTPMPPPSYFETMKDRVAMKDRVVSAPPPSRAEYETNVNALLESVVADFDKAPPRDPSRKVHRITRTVVEKEGQEAPKLLYWFFDMANAVLFGGLLRWVPTIDGGSVQIASGGRLGAPLIWISPAGSPTALGDYSAKDPHGVNSRIRIAPATYKRGMRQVLATLLHEMVHAYCHEVLNDDEDGYKGHGPIFAGECNRIGALLGFATVAPKGRGGLAKAGNWPNLIPSDDDPPPKVRKEKPAIASADASTSSDDVDDLHGDAQGTKHARAIERADVVTFLREYVQEFVAGKKPKFAEQLRAIVEEIEDGAHVGSTL